MKRIDTPIDGLAILEPRVFGDARGYFFESWNEAACAEVGITCRFVQDNESCSRHGVLRGLHWQAAPHTQAKLVRVIRGTVLDVAVDIRANSPTFGKHVAVELTGDNKRQFFIPRGFAHGFAVLSDEAIFAYKCDRPYAPSSECGLRLDDPALAIDWRIPRDPWILSDKDQRHPFLSDLTPWQE